MKKAPTFLAKFIGISLIGTVVLVGLLFLYMQIVLPKVSQLRDVHMQVPLRIFTQEGKLITEYGEKRRMPISLDDVPPNLIHAVLATEDKRFYEHEGIDPIGLLRATIKFVITGRKRQGGSTITMQVARNFFLTRKRTFSRKFNEILLAIKIDHVFGKEKILALYLNKIYLGHRAYGFEAAAHVYYGKSLKQLTLAQLAMLAGLPKAPSSHNPLTDPKAALIRRNYVLHRLLEAHYIDQTTYETTLKAPLTATYHGPRTAVSAPYVAEMVRKKLLKDYGQAAYSLGLQVTTTVRAPLQIAANDALRKTLIAYDQRHGYRGPLAQLGEPSETTLPLWPVALKQFPPVNTLQPAAVLAINPDAATLLLTNGQHVQLFWPEIQWARKEIGHGFLGPVLQTVSDVLTVGDVIYVQEERKGFWQLVQPPQVQGALIALSPKNAAVLAMVGGFDFAKSTYNRSTQASRQTGSAFKPFLYAAALAKGMTLATMINDAPIVIDDPTAEKVWRPQNVDKAFSGLMRLREGLIKSTNLVSVRILRRLGLNTARDFVKRFGFSDNQLPLGLSMALGSGILPPLQLATGYSVFANGGYRVHPFLIDAIKDSNQKILYQKKPDTAPTPENLTPDVPAKQVVSPQVAYLMTSAMRTVIEEGTGRKAKVLKRHDLAGKTGTTNDQVDAWFSGFNQDLAVTCWVGFDDPRSLHEYGSQAALPMWIDFMHQALKHQPEKELIVPSNMVMVRINKHTGEATDNTGEDTMFEVFRQSHAPSIQNTHNVKNTITDNNTSNAGAQLF